MGTNEGYPSIEPEDLDDSLRDQLAQEYVALQASDTAPQAYLLGKAAELEAHGMVVPVEPVGDSAVPDVSYQEIAGEEIPPID